MPGWLEGVLGHLSALEAALSMFGSLVVAVIPLIVKVRLEVRRAQKAMLSVPPTEPPDAPKPGSEVEVPTVRPSEPWVYEQRIRQLTDELRTVGEDHARTARALDSAEKRLALLRAHVLELEERAEAVGHETPTVRPRK